jgi:GNAT superfamily N-acetyltransferase
VPTLTDAVRLFAEEPESLVADAPPPTQRILKPSYCLILSPSPTQSTVTRVRTTEAALDAAIAEVRATARAANYSRVTWIVGPSCRPVGLPALLAQRGFVPATRPPFEPHTTAMALTAPLASQEDGIEARSVRSYEEFVQALRIAMQAFEETEEATAGWIAAAPELWKQQDGIARFTHIAYREGRPVGMAFAVAGPDGLLLGGSGVLAAERSHGAYRALVAARWREAVKLGKPALVIHAGTMSRPIVERCGFEVVCELDSLDDPTFG